VVQFPGGQPQGSSNDATIMIFIFLYIFFNIISYKLLVLLSISILAIISNAEVNLPNPKSKQTRQALIPHLRNRGGGAPGGVILSNQIRVIFYSVQDFNHGIQIPNDFSLYFQSQLKSK